MAETLYVWAGVFLLVGGLIHAIPQLYTMLSGWTGGTPWIQVIVGIISVILALVWLFRK